MCLATCIKKTGTIQTHNFTDTDHFQIIHLIKFYPNLYYLFLSFCCSITSFYTYSRENHFPDDAGDMPGFFNGRVSCQGDDNIPEINLEPWTEGYGKLLNNHLENKPPFCRTKLLPH